MVSSRTSRRSSRRCARSTSFATEFGSSGTPTKERDKRRLELCSSSSTSWAVCLSCRMWSATSPRAGRLWWTRTATCRSISGTPASTGCGSSGSSRPTFTPTSSRVISSSLPRSVDLLRRGCADRLRHRILADIDRHRQLNKNADYWLARSHRFDRLRREHERRRQRQNREAG
jgi:hypothetical protein